MGISPKVSVIAWLEFELDHTVVAVQHVSHYTTETPSCSELNYHDQKISRTPTHDIREHWTAVSTLLGLISNVYHNEQVVQL